MKHLCNPYVTATRKHPIRYLKDLSLVACHSDSGFSCQNSREIPRTAHDITPISHSRIRQSPSLNVCMIRTACPRGHSSDYNVAFTVTICEVCERVVPRVSISITSYRDIVSVLGRYRKNMSLYGSESANKYEIRLFGRPQSVISSTTMRLADLQLQVHPIGINTIAENSEQDLLIIVLVFLKLHIEMNLILKNLIPKVMHILKQMNQLKT